MKKYILLSLALLPLAVPASSEDGGRKLSASLTGAAEVPGPGDADGMGSFKGRVNPGQGEICYTLTASNIQTPNAAHIHRGAAGVAGPVVAPLKAPTTGSSAACVKVTRELAMAIIKMPSDFYVNVHNPEFPRGAVRGQLSK